MKKIFNYDLAIVDKQTIFIPLPAKIISVAEQREHVVLYALVEENSQLPPPKGGGLQLGSTQYSQEDRVD